MIDYIMTTFVLGSVVIRTDSREIAIRSIQSNNIESVLSVEISTNSTNSTHGAVRTSTESSMMFQHSIILVHNCLLYTSDAADE